MVQRRQKFEQQLFAARGEQASIPGSGKFASPVMQQLWVGYINSETKALAKKEFHSSLLTSLYERAIGDCYSSEVLWTRYLDHRAKTASKKQALALPQVYQRAVHNLPLVSVFRTGLVRVLEACMYEEHQDVEELSTRVLQQVEEAILHHSSFPNKGRGLVDVLMCALGCLKRRAFGEYEPRCETAFHVGLTMSVEASYALQEHGDHVSIVPRFQASVTMAQLTDEDADPDFKIARGMWTRLVTKDASSAPNWMAWIQCEMKVVNDEGYVRGLYKKAVQGVRQDGDALEWVARSWLEFELYSEDASYLAWKAATKHVQGLLKAKKKDLKDSFLCYPALHQWSTGGLQQPKKKEAVKKKTSKKKDAGDAKKGALESNSLESSSSPPKKKLKLQEDAPVTLDPALKVYAKNLPWTVESPSGTQTGLNKTNMLTLLQLALPKCQILEAFPVMKDKRVSGFGYITFKDQASMDLALETASKGDLILEKRSLSLEKIKSRTQMMEEKREKAETRSNFGRPQGGKEENCVCVPIAPRLCDQGGLPACTRTLRDIRACRCMEHRDGFFNY